MTDPEWDVTIIDESVELPDYDTMARPDLVGITAFTSQVSRAYDIADAFRARGIPVVMGGIHVSMRPEEAQAHADAVVQGEAESVWPTVLNDARSGQLQPRYVGQHVEMVGNRIVLHIVQAGNLAIHHDPVVSQPGQGPPGPIRSHIADIIGKGDDQFPARRCGGRRIPDPGRCFRMHRPAATTAIQGG